VRDYLEIAARLRHGSPSRAATETQRALDRFGLNGIVAQRLDRLQHFQRRALGIALASLGEPELCALEAPLRGLDAQAADLVGRLVAELGRHCRVLVSSEVPTTPSPERTLLDGCDELFVLLGGELVAQGAPSRVFGPNERYLLTVTGARVHELAEALQTAGCELSARARSGSFSVTLPERATSDLLLDCALDAGVVVHELEPVLVTHSSAGGAGLGTAKIERRRFSAANGSSGFISAVAPWANTPETCPVRRPLFSSTARARSARSNESCQFERFAPGGNGRASVWPCTWI
jgi:ABC-type uncharacterized transport system ATPase subunit